jgi:ABC-type lipoprotein release transport system permease subunit
MMVNWKFGRGEILDRPSPAFCRATPATAFAIVLAFAFSIITRAEQDNKPAVSTTVFAMLRPSYDDRIVHEIRELPQIQAVAPLVTRPTILYVRNEKYHVLASGIDPEFDQEVRGYKVIQGRMLDAKIGGILLGEKFATNSGIKLDQEVQFLTRRGVIDSKIVGFYKMTTGESTSEGVMLIPLRAAQHFFQSPNKIDTAKIALKPDADKGSVEAAIEKILEGKTESLEFFELTREDGGNDNTRRPAQRAGSRK